ncbi:hypothetical protein M5D96_012930 [Drosophila gunungcola]|uniref:Uncharacterized protein n=1 Tax=Drosophila gunungcola TaxID=103775 RepID=A0A9Q0BK10_9MUSC|nr:hypothetical protein M5D96_012930 [Drosophila gunungcola]
MASPCRNPQRTLKSWRLLTESLKLFTLKLGRNQQLVWFKLPGRRLFCLEERRNLNDSLGQCIAGVSLIASVVRSCHLRLDVDRMLLIVEHGQLDGQLKIHEERLRTLDRSELFESRCVMLCGRAFDLSQELIQTRMRINDFENACTQLRRRILELKLRRVQRRRLLSELVLRLRKAQDQQVPPILWRLWHCMRFLWNCVECLGHPSGKLDAINWFMAGY